MLVKIDEEGIQARVRVRAVFIANNYKSTLSTRNLRMHDENTWAVTQRQRDTPPPPLSPKNKIE